MLAIASILTVALSAFTAVATPIRRDTATPDLTAPGLGLQFLSFSTALPLVCLPYGCVRAFSYDSTNDIYYFRNVRYAAPPVGNLRWAKPALPALNFTINDGSYGNTCVQQLPPPVNVDLGGAEDCLFLDVYVPGSVVRNPVAALLNPLPVTAYIHGGAYIFGSKEEGNGTGPIVASGNKMVFVSISYRLGSFGFLAGTTVEQQAQPNAGFYDQRAALQWIQWYIRLFGGDPTDVSAWGESAGAGSILHHLTAFGGTQDPLFSKVAMLSTASEVLVDRKGEVDSFYKEFQAQAGCTGQPISCLRAASFATLKAANQEVIRNVPPSGFKPGPAADGAWVRQMPALELASGNYWKGISAIISSHTANEGFVFVDGEIQTDAQFANLTYFIIPAYAPTVRTAVLNYYPTPPTAQYADQNGRTIQYLDDTNFLCNNRYLNKAYAGKVYSMQYSVGNAFHSDDLGALFYSGTGAASATLDAIYKDYQSYYASLTTAGNPNTNRKTTLTPPTINWPLTTGATSQNLGNVLNVGDTAFSLITDQESLLDRCTFFLNVQAAITLAGGYVPPGGAVPNNLGVTNSNPSGNYTTPSA